MVEVGEGESHGGRAIVLEFQDDAAVILGVDLGATHGSLRSPIRVAPCSPPVLLASGTAQDRDMWRDLATKPARWSRPAVAHPAAPPPSRRALSVARAIAADR